LPSESFLSFGFTFEDLHQADALEKLDGIFLSFLDESASDLAVRLKQARKNGLQKTEESALLIDVAPYVEDFIGNLFSIQEDIHALQDQTFHLAPLYRCKRVFVQRQALKAFSREEALSFNGAQLQHDIEALLGEPYSDLAFARAVLQALDHKENHQPFLKVATAYAAWALHQENPPLLFRLPRKVNPDALIPLQREGRRLTSPQHTPRHGFDCTDPPIDMKEALDQAHYCILCHPQGKDSCAKGYTHQAKGCPLGQKISEMNMLRTQGYTLGALAIIMVDNPMVAATGRRICNDCEKACIFQKQDAVDIPSIESQTLDSVLTLPWGLEIYSLLSRWNPLNLNRPFPKQPSGYKVLVVGMGPAGFTLAHYLLNEGHHVTGLEALKMIPLEEELLKQPIRHWSTLKKPLSQRPIEGFGGVMEFGITARWDKNYLKLIRLLLERRPTFSLVDGVRLGETLTLPEAFDQGFDHVALCLGAGAPRTLSLGTEGQQNLPLSADFLIDLYLKGGIHDLSNIQLRLPILVIGGGLTAVDAATEALAYYKLQVERFLEEKGENASILSPEDQEFVAHGRALREGDESLLKQACTIIYRKKIQESPSYRLNDRELKFALQEGVEFLEDTTPLAVHRNAAGQIEALEVATPSGRELLPCRTLLVAIGTHPHAFLGEDFQLKGESPLLTYKGKEKLSFFGDLHPIYEGNVVKAMASAKNGYPSICKALLNSSNH
jgi:NADPH-dependent glutamate synthase beta subunit-like oxidoreductase